MKKDIEVYCFLVKSLNENYCGELKRGLLTIAEEFKEYNFKIKIIETLIDEPINQIDALKEILNDNKANGIIITPLLKKEIKEIIKKWEKKIRFITLDVPIDEEEYHVGADYYNSGVVAATIMDQFLRKNEKVILFSASNDNISTKLYYDGFKEKIKTSNKIIINGGELDKNFYEGLKKLEKYILDEETIGLYVPRYLPEFIQFLLENKFQVEKLKIVGNGNNKMAVEYLKKGFISALVQEQNFIEGYTAGKYMFDWLFKQINPKIKVLKTEPIIKF